MSFLFWMLLIYISVVMLFMFFPFFMRIIFAFPVMAVFPIVSF